MTTHEGTVRIHIIGMNDEVTRKRAGYCVVVMEHGEEPELLGVFKSLDEARAQVAHLGEERYGKVIFEAAIN
jgi:hypothetical protein